MPVWTSKPPTDEPTHAFRIVRTPADKPLHAIVTSTDIIGTSTHYVGNRTLPCDGPGQCKACEEGHSWRWHGYLACVLAATFEHIIFEFTANASDTFRNYQSAMLNMRGCHFTAHRPSKRHNGRVLIACRPGDHTKLRLPEPPDVPRILCHIWNIPYRDVQLDGVSRQLAHSLSRKGNGKR